MIINYQGYDYVIDEQYVSVINGVIKIEQGAPMVLKSLHDIHSAGETIQTLQAKLDALQAKLDEKPVIPDAPEYINAAIEAANQPIVDEMIEIARKIEILNEA